MEFTVAFLSFLFLPRVSGSEIERIKCFYGRVSVEGGRGGAGREELRSASRPSFVLFLLIPTEACDLQGLRVGEG